MTAYLFLPLAFLKFWFFDAPKEIILYFISFNYAFIQLFSLTLLIRTFFQPIKNEYRKGLVGFSIGMGMVVKTWLIAIDLALLLIILAAQCAFLFAFILLPVATVYLLFM